MGNVSLLLFNQLSVMKSSTFGLCAVSRFKTVAVSAALLALLSACGSNVKLDEVPVTDRTAAPVAPVDVNAANAQVGSRTVPAVVIDESKCVPSSPLPWRHTPNF
jgi:hypothetical protein